MLGTIAEIKRNVGVVGVRWGARGGGRPAGVENPLCCNRGFEIVFLMNIEPCEIICPPSRVAEGARVPGCDSRSTGK